MKIRKRKRILHRQSTFIIIIKCQPPRQSTVLSARPIRSRSHQWQSTAGPGRPGTPNRWSRSYTTSGPHNKPGPTTGPARAHRTQPPARTQAQRPRASPPDKRRRGSRSPPRSAAPSPAPPRTPPSADSFQARTVPKSAAPPPSAAESPRPKWTSSPTSASSTRRRSPPRNPSRRQKTPPPPPTSWRVEPGSRRASYPRALTRPTPGTKERRRSTTSFGLKSP